MNYTKTEWVDLPDTTTPITADKLNNMENGIEYLFEHGVGGDTLPLGTLLPYTGETIPEGYMLCDGSAISRTTYASLFDVIGTTFGEGDGTTTFNLPNLKGRVVIGKDTNDNDFDTVGETGGEKEHTLTVNEMPSHTHGLSGGGEHTHTFTGFIQTAVNSSQNYISIAHNRLDADGANTPPSMNNSGTHSHSINNSGGNQSHNNMQPYIVVNFIIKTTEITVTQSQVIDGDSNSHVNSYSCNYINNKITDINGRVLWTNPDPTQAISEAMDITLSLSDYDVLEIFFNQRSFNNVASYSIKFIKNSVGTRCYIPSTDGNIYRTITKNSDTSFTISTIIGSSNNDSSLVIPLYVVGYKTGWFE